MGVALATVELLTPAWFATVTGTFEAASIAYAVVAALGFAASSLGSALSMRFLALTGSPRRATMGGFLVRHWPCSGWRRPPCSAGLLRSSPPASPTS